MTKTEELAALRELRGKILGVMSGSLPSSEIENYSYSDSDGTQSVRRRNPKELMDWLNEVDKKIAVLERSFQGGGVMTFGTNRYG